MKITKSSNASGNANRITTASGTQVLQLQGTAKTTQNSIVFTVPAGKTTITVKYFQGAGRYLVLFDESGSAVADSSANPTTNNSISDEKSHTFTVTPTAKTTYYLGSQNQGIYITYLKIDPTAQ